MKIRQATAIDTAAPTEKAVASLQRVAIISGVVADVDSLQACLQRQYDHRVEVLWIGEGFAVIETIEAFKPDLVITDHELPGYDVIAMLVELRRRWPSLPSLVLSGRANEEAAILALKAGASDYLPKSRMERLPLVIERELAAARAQRAQAQLRAELDSQRSVNQAIFDQAPAGMWILSPDGMIQRSNRQGQQMMEGLVKKDGADFSAVQGWWADSGNAISAEELSGRGAIARHGLATPKLVRLRTLQGEDRHYSMGAAPLQGEDGRNLGAVLTAMDLSAEVELRERLREAEQRLRNLSISQFELHEKQMANVSRELHDNLGQVLSLLKLHLSSAADRERTVPHRDAEIAAALPLVDLALSRLREVCGDLRPSELSDFGLGTALQSICAAAARASGIDVRIKVEDHHWQDLPPNLQMGLFRIAQQALTNALRHAEASEVSMSLQRHERTVELLVDDNGTGFIVNAQRLPNQQGLRGMRERMELLGGSLQIDSTPGKGSSIRATVPCNLRAGNA